MIPMIFHRCVPAHVPAEFDAWWDRFAELHPAWMFNTVADPIDPTHYELGHLHQRCTTGAQLAGMVRLELVWRYGGIYVDMDVEPLRSFDELRSHDCFVGTEDGHHLTDAVFGAEAGHPAVRACIDRLLDGYWSKNPSETGPVLMTNTFRAVGGVTVLPKAAFYPYSWDEDDPGTYGDSFAVHRWNHSWKEWGL